MNRTYLSFRHLAGILCFGAYSLQATTFTVTRTNVTGPGSLPVIINQANVTPGDNVIEFAVTNPIVLVAPLPTVTNNVTINGRIDVPTVISGGGHGADIRFRGGHNEYPLQFGPDERLHERQRCGHEQRWRPVH